MKTTIFASLGFVLVFTPTLITLGQADSVPPLGSVQAHQIMWAQQGAQTEVLQARARAIEVESQEEEKLKARVESQTRTLNAARARMSNLPVISLAKGEFETTAEYQERRQAAKAAQTTAAAEQVRKAGEDLAAATAALKSFKDGRRTKTDSSFAGRAKSEITGHPQIFHVQATMDPYDADNARIPSFTIFSPYKVGDVAGVPEIYEFRGSCAGISVDRVTARTIREFSDASCLLVQFETTPLSLGFESYRREIVTPAKPAQEASDTEKGLLSLAAAGLAAALGADNPGEIGMNARAGMEGTHAKSLIHTSSPEIARTYPVRLIRIGWDGKAQVQKLWGWDSTAREWKQLWRMQ